MVASGDRSVTGQHGRYAAREVPKCSSRPSREGEKRICIRENAGLYLVLTMNGHKSMLHEGYRVITPTKWQSRSASRGTCDADFGASSSQNTFTTILKGRIFCNGDPQTRNSNYSAS